MVDEIRPKVLHMRIPHTYPYDKLKKVLDAIESAGHTITFVDNGNITIEEKTTER